MSDVFHPGAVCPAPARGTHAYLPHPCNPWLGMLERMLGGAAIARDAAPASLRGNYRAGWAQAPPETQAPPSPPLVGRTSGSGSSSRRLRSPGCRRREPRVSQRRLLRPLFPPPPNPAWHLALAFSGPAQPSHRLARYIPGWATLRGAIVLLRPQQSPRLTLLLPPLLSPQVSSAAHPGTQPGCRWLPHLGPPPFSFPLIREPRPSMGVASEGRLCIRIGSGESRPRPSSVSERSPSLGLPSSRKGRELCSDLLAESPPIAPGVLARPSGKCGPRMAGSADGNGGRNYESPSGLARLLLGRIPDNAWFLSGPSGVAGVNWSGSWRGLQRWEVKSVPQLPVRRGFSVRVRTAPRAARAARDQAEAEAEAPGLGSGRRAGGRAGSGALWASARSLRELRKAGL